GRAGAAGLYLADRARSRPRRRAGDVPHERPLHRLRPHQRGVPDVSRLVVKVGGAVVESAALHLLDLVAAGNEVCVVHGAGPQISAAMERLGLPVAFVAGRRVTTPETLAVVRECLVAVNGELCGALGARAVGLVGDEIG